MQSFLMNRSERPMTNTEKRDLIQLVLVQADPTLADLMISQAVDSVEAIFHSKKQMTYSGDFLVAEIHSKISLEMMTTFLDMDSGEDLTRLNLKIRDRILLADLVVLEDLWWRTMTFLAATWKWEEVLVHFSPAVSHLEVREAQVWALRLLLKTEKELLELRKLL